MNLEHLLEQNWIFVLTVWIKSLLTSLNNIRIRYSRKESCKNMINEDIEKLDKTPKVKYPNYITKKFLEQDIHIQEVKKGYQHFSNEEKDVQTLKKSNKSTTWVTDESLREELVSAFVKTSNQLQEMVRGYELKVNQTTQHISCLQEHIRLVHNQLTHKNKMIGRLCDRYVALCKEKQTTEDHLQQKIDELSSVVEAYSCENTGQLHKLLIGQINRNRHLEYQNMSLAQQITKLCHQPSKPSF